MPFNFQDLTFSDGTPYLRVEVSDHVGLADGEALEARLVRPNYRRGKMLSVVAKGTVYAPEVRKFFPTIDHLFGVVAIVVTSPIVRAAIKIMLRLSPHHGHVDLFRDEVAALAWLEAKPMRDPE